MSNSSDNNGRFGQRAGTGPRGGANRLITADELTGASVMRFSALNQAPAPVGKPSASNGAAPPASGGLNHAGLGRRRMAGAAQADESAQREAAALNAKLQAAHADGYARGYAQAEADLRAPLHAARAHLLATAEQAQLQAEALDAETAAQVIALANAIARQVVRAEISAQPHAISDVVHEGLALISDAVARVTVHLHPDDAAMVGTDLGRYDERVHIVEDVGVQRGGCRFHTAHGDIDATIERRFAQATAALGVPQQVRDDMPHPANADLPDDDETL